MGMGAGGSLRGQRRILVCVDEMMSLIGVSKEGNYRVAYGIT